LSEWSKQSDTELAERAEQGGWSRKEGRDTTVTFERRRRAGWVGAVSERGRRLVAGAASGGCKRGLLAAA
jgi:hypothetical protein